MVPHSQPPYLPSDLSGTPALSVRLPASAFLLAASLGLLLLALSSTSNSQTVTAAPLPTPSHYSPTQPSPQHPPPPHPATGGCRASTPLPGLLSPSSCLSVSQFQQQLQQQESGNHSLSFLSRALVCCGITRTFRVIPSATLPLFKQPLCIYRDLPMCEEIKITLHG